MPPSIPTYRPLLTATRSAILVAIVAMGCGIFLAVDGAYARLSTTAFASQAGWVCALAPMRDTRVFANRADQDSSAQ